MNKVRIEPQEIYVWLACADGWHRHLGLKATIAGLECSVCLVRGSLVKSIVSVLESGVGIGDISISDSELMKNNTEDEALDLMTSKLEVFVPLIERFGIANIKEDADQKSKATEALFGKRPKMEIAEVFSLVEAENNQERGKKINDS
ncbi:hypothetical protein [Enterococcus sp. DIV1420a]|uniref:hypothetical protein n=1 Tax=Enterococcus sp. DIV1420a TaxID=2774672 RepID=UPI003F299667